MNSEYDNDKFFEEYSKMSRSKVGLNAAGEWHQLRLLFPPLRGKMFLIWGAGTVGTVCFPRKTERRGCLE